MKISGAWFPPAGALAVLFVDNHAFRTNIGRAYCLMPGISGTAVLFLLACIKVEVSRVPKEAIPKKGHLDSKAKQTHPNSEKPSSLPSPEHAPDNTSSEKSWLLDWLGCLG